MTRGSREESEEQRARDAEQDALRDEDQDSDDHVTAWPAPTFALEFGQRLPTEALRAKAGLLTPLRSFGSQAIFPQHISSDLTDKRVPSRRVTGGAQRVFGNRPAG